MLMTLFSHKDYINYQFNVKKTSLTQHVTVNFINRNADLFRFLFRVHQHFTNCEHDFTQSTFKNCKLT